MLFLFDLKSKEHNSSVYLLFLLFSIIIIAIIYWINRKFKNTSFELYHRFYALAVIVLGLVFVAIAPPFMGSDEKPHFFRAYEISEGHLISKADDVGILATMPRSLNKAYSGYDDENISLKSSISYDDIPSRLRIPLEKDNLLNYCSCNETNYFGASLYSPFQYLPHLIGIEFGKVMNLGPTWILYLARICNLLCFAVLTVIGIKLLPKFKLPAMLILLSPVVLSGATTVSADGITNAVIFLFISYIVNLIYNKKDIRVKEKVILSSLSFLIAMCKIVYFPIIALVFLLPNKQFKSRKDALLFKIILFVIGVLLSLSWLYIASMFMNSQSTTSNGQVSYILTHPLDFIIAVVRTYIYYVDRDLLNIFFGNQMYNWQLKVYPLFSLLYVAVIVLSLFTERSKLNISKKSKILVGMIILIILGLISAALFVQHNAGLSSGLIGGIQARYYIPLCFLTLLLLNIKKVKISDKIVFDLFILLYFPTILTIVIRFI